MAKTTRIWLAVCAASLLCASNVSAQSYNEIERRALENIERRRAAEVGDCSMAMLSWLSLRFTREQARQGKAGQACEDAQRMALRTGLPFREVLPEVARAHGGTQVATCPPEATSGSDYRLFSGCQPPQPAYVRPPPTKWETDRAAEVDELGAAVLAHLAKCVGRSSTHFAFTVRLDGRIDAFSDAGAYGRVGPQPGEATELRRIERILRTDERCNVWPEVLRNRYISIEPNWDGRGRETGALKVAQVRDESRPSR